MVVHITAHFALIAMEDVGPLHNLTLSAKQFWRLGHRVQITILWYVARSNISTYELEVTDEPENTKEVEEERRHPYAVFASHEIVFLMIRTIGWQFWLISIQDLIINEAIGLRRLS